MHRTRSGPVTVDFLRIDIADVGRNDTALFDHCSDTMRLASHEGHSGAPLHINAMSLMALCAHRGVTQCRVYFRTGRPRHSPFDPNSPSSVMSAKCSASPRSRHHSTRPTARSTRQHPKDPVCRCHPSAPENLLSKCEISDSVNLPTRGSILEMRCPLLASRSVSAGRAGQGGQRCASPNAART